MMIYHAPETIIFCISFGSESKIFSNIRLLRPQNKQNSLLKAHEIYY